ncbi:MAG TPA: hypothetical protein VF634_00070, partial [Pyrinomonadaceae bacterium]
MAFWRRKKEDRYITLGLNEPLKPATKEPLKEDDRGARPEPPANLDATTKTASVIAPAPLPPLEPTVTGDAPTPLPQGRGNDAGIGASAPDAARANNAPTTTTGGAARTTPEPAKPGVSQQRPVPTRSTFSTSILGLDRSMEELQAEEAAL